MFICIDYNAFYQDDKICFHISRTVLPEEAKSFCLSQECCTFVETSAKKNVQVDDVFYELFLIANLPLEMAPNHHKRVSASFGSPCPLPPPASSSHHSKKYTLSVKRRLSDACGVVTPNVRRPSIRTDLMIMRAKTCSLGDNNGNGNNSVLNWRPLEYRCILQ